MTRTVTVEVPKPCLTASPTDMPPPQLPFEDEVVDAPTCPADLDCLTPKGSTAIQVNLKKLRNYAQHVWALCGPKSPASVSP